MLLCAILLVINASPALSANEPTQGIIYVPSTEDKTIIPISQYLRLEIKPTRALKKTFVEYIVKGDALTVTVLPRSQPQEFELVDTTPLQTRKTLVQTIDGVASELYAHKVLDSESRYAISGGIAALSFTEESLTVKNGIASWYAYKKCLCAASRDFKKGTRLKVSRLSTGKSIEVVVNDYGPQLWTGRIIDLDKVAFQALGASLGAGLMPVRVEPVL